MQELVLEKQKRPQKDSILYSGSPAEKVVYLKALDDKLLQEFLETNPSNRVLCAILCKGSAVKEWAWGELLKKGLFKQDFIYLFQHLRNDRFLNAKVWEEF